MSREFDLHQGEHIIMTVRKHPLIIIGALIPFAVLDYLPYLLPNLGQFLEAVGSAQAVAWADIFSFDNPWTRFIVGVYWLFVWMGAFGTFTDYYLDQLIITNERIVDINQKGFWNREVASIMLTRIQDVETNVHGLFGTLFHYGTITIESAGAESQKVHMHGVGTPTHIRDLVMKEAQRVRKEELSLRAEV